MRLVTSRGGSPYTSPSRYADLKVAAGKLFTGVHNGVDEARADVLNTLTGNSGDWARSNTPGFGVVEGYGTSALASWGPNLYASVVSLYSDFGFQIWRRNAVLVEMLPYIAELRDSLVYQRSAWLRCLRRPSCRRWEAVFVPMQGLSLMFDTARNQQDDQQTIMWARQSLAGAVALLDEAKKLADRADKEKNPKKARILRKQAAEKATLAIDTAVEVCRKIGA